MILKDIIEKNVERFFQSIWEYTKGKKLQTSKNLWFLIIHTKLMVKL